jgi:hypothetical protein
MLMHINDQQRIVDIQKMFREVFPYLTLGIFVHHVTNGHHSNSVNGLKTIGELRRTHHNGALSITPSMTVAELERAFQRGYGLSVKVFRQSGKAWLETSVTNDWTLAEQNAEGQSLSGNK